ncbi:hypothetical protein Ahy_B03g067272 [Arachis hypogaea]|uniref:CCHC-type domain-containing protein n=1 Tax=Arachis hypogaea TaxID=3818 RepID=A0A445A6B0_ARAHY|nr:hypothetical protein Ahy_B03g067272 [Arachis hypogaea]
MKIQAEENIDKNVVSKISYKESPLTMPETWKEIPTNPYESVAMKKNYFHALLGGPWMVARHYLIVQRWRPFFFSSENEVKKIAAWIRIPNLPIELYNHRFLCKVGSTIGIVLKVDRATFIHSRGHFARICVKLDLSKKLVPRISILRNVLNTEYEGLHLICFSCGKYGHRSDLCMEVPKKMEVKWS